MGEEGSREEVGPPQVAFAALSLGRSGPCSGGARPSLVSTSGFLSFIFGGGGSLAFRGDQGWRPPHHALGHPTSFTSPCSNFEDPAFQVAKGGSQKGSWPQLGAASRCENRGPWASAARTPVLYPFLKPPRPSFRGNITPRAIFRERAVLWMACAF